jgi:hypothetical protein
MTLAGSAALALSVLVPHLVVFVVTSMVAIAAAGATSPLLTQIYQDNYPDHERGRLFSRSVMIRILTAVVFSAGAGWLLAVDIRYFRGLLGIFAAALAFAAWCLWHIPSTPLHVSGGQHPFRAFQHVRDDRVFRTTLISWMLMGFANLMMLPLRVEYLANPKYNLAMRPDTIALLTGVVPNVARLVMSPLWGWLFDRANFFVVRMTLNLGFAIGIVSFFTSDSMAVRIAAITYGCRWRAATSRGIWSLNRATTARRRLHGRHVFTRVEASSTAGRIRPRRKVAMTSLGWVSSALIIAGSSCCCRRAGAARAEAFSPAVAHRRRADLRQVVAGVRQPDVNGSPATLGLLRPSARPTAGGAAWTSA